MRAAQLDQAAHELEQRALVVVELPVEPRDLVVLAPRVVVAALRARELVAAEQHRHALREEQRREEVPLLPRAQRVDVRIVGRPFDAAVPRAVVVGAVAVVLAVRVVVLLVVRDEVAQREAVVRGDEVDRRERPLAVALVEIRRAAEARRELRDADRAAPEVAHRVAVDAVPLRPEDREVADLVAAGPDVPRLGDQLHLGEQRVLVDDVEERGEAIDVVELARERRREVEAEAVDVADVRPVAQRVHDQPQHARVHRVERVARAGEVHVVARVVRHQPVVRRVVDALEAEHRPEVVALGGVVVDDVEDHLDAGAVQRLHHPLELAHLLAAAVARRVQRVRREVADRRVAPVVRQALVVQEPLVRDVVDREQLDGGDAEALQVRDRRVRREPRVRAAQVLAHVGVLLREALDVHLVDDGLVPRRARARVVVAFPVEALVDDDALRHRRGVVGGVDVEVRVVAVRDVRQRARAAVVDGAVDRLRVRVEQQLRGVEARALLGRPVRRGRGTRSAGPGGRRAGSRAS